ncbi:CBS domain-containing protein [Actinomadura vinacea]|uniref:CBS domain-containing protein n=1 Tax=Actinomadura vinacea TaxID=115336 RepID=A0ABN3JQL3_9ACTN
MQRRTVEQVMTTPVIAVVEETPFMEIAEAMARHSIKAVPVVDRDGRVVGIVSDADLLHKEEFKEPGGLERRLFEGRRRRSARAKAAATDAVGLMTAPVVTLTPGMPVAKAARILAEHGCKQAPVIDRTGRLIGIVTRSDLLRLFLRSDEDIRDEIIREVLVRGLWQDPSRIHVRVHEGVVGLSGQLETKSLVPVCVRLAAATEGVVDVVNDLTFVHDDTVAPAYPEV